MDEWVEMTKEELDAYEAWAQSELKRKLMTGDVVGMQASEKD